MYQKNKEIRKYVECTLSKFGDFDYVKNCRVKLDDLAAFLRTTYQDSGNLTWEEQVKLVFLIDRRVVELENTGYFFEPLPKIFYKYFCMLREKKPEEFDRVYLEMEDDFNKR